MIFRYTLSSTYSGSLILSKDPKGWESMETIIKRGVQYHGTFYETMVQLQFACGSGKEYIDNIYEVYGIDAVINIKIDISCAGGNGNINSPDYSDDYSDDYGSILQGSGVSVYQTFFEGTLDLSKYNKTTRYTFVDLLQSDFIQKVMNRFETKIEVTKNISLDDVALDPIANFPSGMTLHSKELIIQAEYELYPDTGTLFLPFALDAINIEIPMINIVDDIGTAKDITPPYIFSFLSSGGASGPENTEPIYTNTSSEPITFDFIYDITGALNIRNELTSTINYYLYLQFGTQFAYSPAPLVLQSQLGIPLNGGVALAISVVASGTMPLTIQPGDSLFLTFGIADIVGNVADPSLFEFLGFEASSFDVKLRNLSTTEASQGSMFKIHELGAAIAQRITSNEDAFRSELLGRKNSLPNFYDENGCGSFNGLLNGKHVRGFSVVDAPFFMSMNEYFRTVNSLYNCGMGFEKIGDQYVIRIEKKEYFYDTTVLFSCPNANEIRTSVAKEYYITNVVIGYNEWESENFNGLDEFNTNRQYDVGIKAIDSKLDVTAPVIASMYSIEFARRQGVSTVDYKYDNSNFIVCLARGVDGGGNPNQLDIAEKDENFSAVNNIKSPTTSYNLRIPPARNVLSHMNSIASSIIKYTGRAVKFVYGEGNCIAETQLSTDTCANNFDNEVLIENQDITVDQAGATPIWIPEYIEFDYPMGLNTFLSIKNSPYGCIEVSNTEANFVKGFIIELRYKPVGGMASFKLLRAFE